MNIFYRSQLPVINFPVTIMSTRFTSTSNSIFFIAQKHGDESRKYFPLKNSTTPMHATTYTVVKCLLETIFHIDNSYYKAHEMAAFYRDF